MKSLFRDKVDETKYYIATYRLKASPSSTLREAAFNLAVGQSIGNPTKRAEMETAEMFANHACIILGDEDAGCQDGHITKSLNNSKACR